MNSTLKGKINYNKLTGKLNLGKEKVYPTGTINIKGNGLFNVAEYGTANVQLTEDDIVEKIITFMDYDGTFLYEIKLNELNEMPPLPEHEGLICQGWNWTLEQIKEENASLYVGPLYTTDDEKTRIYITLGENDLDLWLSFSHPGGKTMYIDFGDGVEYTSDTGGFISLNHIYPSAGDYVIKLYCDNSNNNKYTLSGYNKKPGVLLCRRKVAEKYDTSIKDNETLMPAITKVEVGKRISFDNSSFSYATNMKSITVSATLNRLYTGSSLYKTQSLKAIVCSPATGFNIPNECLSSSGIEYIITSPTFNGWDCGTFNGIDDVPVSLKQCYIRKGTTVLPKLSGSRVIIKRLPDKLTTIGCPTKVDDQFTYVPETVRRYSEYALRGYKGKTYTFSEKTALHWTSVFKDNKYIEEVYYHPDIYLGNEFTFSDAFDNCYNLRTVHFPKRCGSKTNIGQSWFQNCKKLTEVKLPEDIITLPAYAFENCSSLRQIDIPETVTQIYQNVFKGCSSLEEITIPSGVTLIDDYAFGGCASLKDIQLPDALTELGVYAFSECSSITEITIPNNITTIGAYLFNKATKLKKVTLPNTLTAIPNYIFYECSSLEDVNIPTSLTKVGDYAFHACTTISEITLPDTVTSIGKYAFDGCHNLSYIRVPLGLTNIGAYAFDLSDAKTNIVSYDHVIDFRHFTSIPTVQTTSITKHTRIKIVVPDDLYDTWITTGNWTVYKQYIIKASDYTE